MTLSIEEWVGSVLPTLREPAWVKDAHSRFVGVTESFTLECRHTPDELIGMDESVCFSSAKVARFRADDRVAVGRGIGVVVPEEGPEGAYRTLKSPIYDALGRLTGTVGIAVKADGRCESRLSELRSFVRSRPHRADAPDWIVHVRALLRRQFSKPVQLEPIARAVGRNAEYITRMFRRHYGVAPVEYVHRLRCEWVANECVASARALTELALVSGFTDQSHLTHVFTRYFGLPPATYRRTLRVPADADRITGAA